MAKTGFSLKTTTVEFNPFTFKLKCGSFDLLSTENTPAVSVHSLIADIAAIPLLRMDLVCSSLIVDQLKMEVVRNKDKSYNLERLFSRPAPNKQSDIIGFSDLPFFFSFNNIVVKNSHITFNDNPAGKTHTIDNIELKLPTFSNIQFEADQYIQPFFSAVINGSPVELTGKTSAGYGFIHTAPTELSSHLKELNLKLYSQYLPFNLPFIIEDGKASGSIELFFDPKLEKGEKLAINFDLKLSELKLHDLKNNLAINSNDATLKGSFEPIRNNLYIKEIDLQKPAIHYKGGSSPSSSASAAKQLLDAPPNTPEINPFSYRVETLTLFDGTVAINPTKDTAEQHWSSLALQVKNFRNNASLLKFKSDSSGSFQLKAQRTRATSHLTYIGSFIDEKKLSGTLNLTNASSDTLLSLFLDQKTPISRGRGALSGLLNLEYSQMHQTWSTDLRAGNITLNDFKIISGKSSVFSSAHLEMDGIQLKGNIVNLGTVTVKNGHLNVIDNKLPEEVGTFFTEDIKMDQIDYHGSLTLLGDSGKGKSASVQSLQIKATDLADKQSDNLFFAGSIGEGGQFKGEGSMELHPFSLTAKTEFNNLPVEEFLPHFTPIQDSAPFKRSSGTFGGKGTLALPDFSYQGLLQITDGEMISTDKEIIRWKSLSLNGLDYAKYPIRFIAKTVELNQPIFQWRISPTGQSLFQDISVYFTNFFQSDDSSGGNEEKTSGVVDIQRFEISEGIIDLADLRLSPKWTAKLSQLEGSIASINSTDETAPSSLYFKALLNASPITFQGKTNVFGTDSNNQLELHLENFPLDSFQKQLSDQIDFDTSTSLFDLKLSIRQGRESSLNSGEMVLHGINFPSEDDTLALSLGLLAGSNNSIAINFSYDTTEDQNTSLFDSALSSFQRTLIKGSISPLLLAKEDFSDLIDVAWITFRPGEFILTEEGRNYLQRFGHLLKSYPFIGLRLSGGIHPEEDRKALKTFLTIREQHRVDLENEKRFIQFQTQKQAYDSQLVATSKQSEKEGEIAELNIPPAILTGFTPVKPTPIVVDDSMLLDLATKRIKHIEKNLAPLNSLEFQRIVTDTQTRLPKAQDPQMSGVQIQLIPVDK